MTLRNWIKFESGWVLVVLAFGAPLAAGFLQAGAAAPQVLAPVAALLDPGEENPGGAATAQRAAGTRDAFSQSSGGIGFDGEGKFKVGNAIFRKLWVAAPSSTDTSDGLGPLYNARGCQNCHLKDGRGHPPTGNYPDGDAVSSLLRLSIPPQTDEQRRLLAEGRIKSVDEPVYGGQLQDVAIPGLDAEGHIHIDYSDVPVTLGDGTVVTLRQPKVSVSEPMFGALHAGTMTSLRVASQMIGLGLLEAIPEEAVRAKADADDADKDGISGRVNEVWSAIENRLVLGRFGWKAGAPTIQEQSAGAFNGDMGISSPIAPHPAGDCTAAQVQCMKAPNGTSERQDGYEIGTELFNLVTFYAQNLAVPARRDPGSDVVLTGKALFQSSGCSGCHTPSHTTGISNGQPHLSNQKIWPYTDLLLHDMGEGLADNRPEGKADGTEWRTAPLWGIGLTETVSGHTFFLHDGRARNLEEAILWHGGEAKTSRDAYAGLKKEDRDALLAFVKSL
jgi:CxxC motif-containing protein (DUF1111 family)